MGRIQDIIDIGVMFHTSDAKKRGVNYLRLAVMDGVKAYLALDKDPSFLEFRTRFAVANTPVDKYEELLAILEYRGITIESRSIKGDTLHLLINLTPEEVSEYTSSMTMKDVLKDFTASFTEGVCVYGPLAYASLRNETKIYVLAHPDEFIISSELKEDFCTVTPKIKPKGELATNQDKAMRHLTEELIHDLLEMSLVIAYGGVWDTMGRTLSSVVKGQFNSLYCKHISSLSRDLEVELNTTAAVEYYLKKSEEQNTRLLGMVKDAGGDAEFKEKLIEDILEAIPLKAAMFADHEEPQVRNLAKLALRGSNRG